MHNLEVSTISHFDKHGQEVGANTAQQYFDKVKAFASNLKGVKSLSVPGATDNVMSRPR